MKNYYRKSKWPSVNAVFTEETPTCVRGRACGRACDRGTAWRLQMLSSQGIPEMASITVGMERGCVCVSGGGGAGRGDQSRSGVMPLRYYRLLSICTQDSSDQQRWVSSNPSSLSFIGPIHPSIHPPHWAISVFMKTFGRSHISRGVKSLPKTSSQSGLEHLVTAK